MAVLRVRLLLLTFVVAMMSGCAHQTRNGLIRVWGDYNTYRQPTVFYEQLLHWPHKPKRVALYRWMYNKPDSRWAGYTKLNTVVTTSSVSMPVNDDRVIIPSREDGPSERLRPVPSEPMIPPVQPVPSNALPPAPELPPALSPEPKGVIPRPPVLPNQRLPKKEQGPSANKGRVKRSSYENFHRENQQRNPVSLQRPVSIPVETNNDIQPRRNWFLWGR